MQSLIFRSAPSVIDASSRSALELLTFGPQPRLRKTSAWTYHYDNFDI